MVNTTVQSQPFAESFVLSESISQLGVTAYARVGNQVIALQSTRQRGRTKSGLGMQPLSGDG